MTARSLGAGLACFLAIALAACGGDSDDGTDAANQPGAEDAAAGGMPDLIGATREQAEARLTAANPTYRLRINYHQSFEQPEGRVFKQSPAAGTPLTPGQLYHVVFAISEGPVADRCEYPGAGNLPVSLDCDPVSGEAAALGDTCPKLGRSGYFDHLECAKSRLCHDLRWDAKEGNPPPPPCSSFRVDESLPPGATPCVPGEPLPENQVCVPVDD